MLYDGFGARIRAEYDLFLFALTGRYLSVTAPGVQVSPMLVDQFERSAFGLRNTFLKSAKRTTADYLDTQGMAASGDRVTRFHAELDRVTLENVASLSHRMKGFKINALDAVENAHGAMGLLLQRKLSTPEFNVTSASGRSFKAASFVKTQARDFAYRVWLDARMLALLPNGDLATVVYDDEHHAAHGVVFSITGDTKGYPSFEELEEPVFHFNAHARIAPHVSP